MRRAAKVDTNHKAIVTALRAAGVSVTSLAGLGEGVPDLLCGFRGRNVLLEVKDGARPLSEQQLTPAQEKWFRAWKGNAYVVHSVDEAFLAIRGML